MALFPTPLRQTNSLMSQRYLWLLFFLLLHCCARAQCPDNIGFGRGNLDNWSCSMGFVEIGSTGNTMILTPSPPTLGHHDITDSTGGILDPYGDFPIVCPFGGRYSVKLGNDMVDKEADGLSYTFRVPANLDTFTITFFYAVVLQNPGHSPSEQPRFTVTARNEGTGDVVNCSDFDFVASGGIPGFKSSLVDPTVVYKEWTPASLQFTGMAGETITLDFRVADCTRGGHFGYAYVDVSDNCTGQLATAPYCPAANALVLNAPYGFRTYTWYNEDFSQIVGTGQSVTLSPPPTTSGAFWVSMFPYPGYGCPDTVKAVVTPYPVPPPPAVRDFYYCQNQNPYPVSATALPGHLLQWYNAPTGGIPSTSPPTPSTTTLGVLEYWVSQKQLFGCESTRVPLRVHVHGPVPVTLTVNQDRQCFQGHNFVFTNTTANLASPYYELYFGDGYRLPAQPGVPVTHRYTHSGAFRAKLVLDKTGVCSDSAGINIVVVPNPVAYVAGPSSICVGAAGATLSDSSLVVGSSIAQWWWNVGGVVSAVPHPPLPSNAAGPVSVDLVVTTPEGCRSDTAHKVLPVHDRPVADFTFSGYCDNEPLRLRDASFQPPNLQGERVDAWYWSANGAPLSSASNPDVLLSGGTHRIGLVVRNNFGCTSDPVDRLVSLSAHPRIGVQVGDSCAGRPIQFTATVLSGTVQDWRWNVGAGWSVGGMQLRQTFLQAGIRLLQVIATAPDGCRDTLRRDLPVIRNNAFAGNDTAAAYGEGVQLDAHGDSSMRYTWSPADGLDDPASGRPLALWPSDIRYELHAVDRFGCESRSHILVRRYLGPDLYVPSAFTPNDDGRNDRLRVRPVGIRTLHYFAVYARGGQLVYRSTEASEGWDGTFNGVALGAQTVIWVAEGTDYKGQKVFRKGAATLVR